MNYNQIRLEVRHTYEKDEKKTTVFEPNSNEDVKSKAYLDEKLLKIKGYLSLLEKDYNEFILHYNKQTVEEILVQRAVKTTVQILYDKGFFR